MSFTAERPPTNRRLFEVCVEDGKTWVRRLGNPVGYFDRIDEEQGEHAAGLLGMAESQARQQRSGRAQERKGMVAALPGWHWWRPC